MLMCKRGHGEWFLTKVVGKRNRVCWYIMAHRMKEGLGDNALLCCDLPIGKTIPKGWQQV